MGEVGPKMIRQPSLPIPIGGHIQLYTQLQDTRLNIEKEKNPKTMKILNFFWEDNILVWKKIAWVCITLC